MAGTTCRVYRCIGNRYAIICIDGWITPKEKEYLNHILSTKSIFQGHDIELYYNRIKEAKAKTSSKEMIDNSITTVQPERTRQTLFSLAVEMVVIDGSVTAEETEILYYLSDALGLDRGLSDNIIKIMLIRNSGNIAL